MTRRRPHLARGFSLAEALVAVGVASLTILILTSAVWGLRFAMQPAPAAQATAADWLSARRALQSWAAGITSDGRFAAEGRIEGTADRARMVVDPYAAGLDRVFVGDLRILIEDGVYTLTAARHRDLRDARLSAEASSVSRILSSTQPIRLVYLMNSSNSRNAVWRYEANPADGLPQAIGIEMDTDRIVTARLFNTYSGACIYAFGESGLGETRCALR